VATHPSPIEGEGVRGQCLIPLGSALLKLPLWIGDDLLRIG
jgi:hypothetical protein